MCHEMRDDDRFSQVFKLDRARETGRRGSMDSPNFSSLTKLDKIGRSSSFNDIVLKMKIQRVAASDSNIAEVCKVV